MVLDARQPGQTGSPGSGRSPNGGAGAAGAPPHEFPPITVAGETRFQAIIRQTVLDEIRAHGESAPEVEVCGVLVGTVYENETAALAYADACVRGTNAATHAAQVTFTAETWAHIQKEMDQNHAGKRIIGWYHTHPGFGIFLSEMDLFIQEHFFNAPWQVAFVYDPKSREHGLFAWRDGKVVQDEFLIDDGVPGRRGRDPKPSGHQDAKDATGADGDTRPADEDDRLSDDDAARLTRNAYRSGSVSAPTTAPGTITDLSARLQALEQRQRVMLVTLGLLALLAIAWPLVVFVLLPDLMPDLRGGAPSGQNPSPIAQPRPAPSPLDPLGEGLDTPGPVPPPLPSPLPATAPVPVPVHVRVPVPASAPAATKPAKPVPAPTGTATTRIGRRPLGSTTAPSSRPARMR